MENQFVVLRGVYLTLSTGRYKYSLKSRREPGAGKKLMSSTQQLAQIPVPMLVAKGLPSDYRNPIPGVISGVQS